jgi:hypothetical protein
MQQVDRISSRNSGLIAGDGMRSAVPQFHGVAGETLRQGACATVGKSSLVAQHDLTGLRIIRLI